MNLVHEYTPHWSWSPVTGCNRNCTYCITKYIAEKKGRSFAPKFHPGRLEAPYNTIIPEEHRGKPGINIVAVCNGSELFGHWVETENILQVIEIVRDTPQWEYQFVTKYPERLLKLNIDFPANSFIGVSITRQSQVEPGIEALRAVNANRTLAECVPLLEQLKFRSLEGITWVQIGAKMGLPGDPPFIPPVKWIYDIFRVAVRDGCRTALTPDMHALIPSFTNFADFPRIRQRVYSLLADPDLWLPGLPDKRNEEDVFEFLGYEDFERGFARLSTG
jgi:protein gp37